MIREEKATLYSRVFRTGGQILKNLRGNSRDGAEKRMGTIILNLRAEALPDKLRREFLWIIAESTKMFSKPKYSIEIVK